MNALPVVRPLWCNALGGGPPCLKKKKQCVLVAGWGPLLRCRGIKPRFLVRKYGLYINMCKYCGKKVDEAVNSATVGEDSSPTFHTGSMHLLCHVFFDVVQRKRTQISHIRIAGDWSGQL